ncbi:peptidylprolyl isomerase [Gallibacterium sp. AGMB14963]|uniref:peptidylprolyl isomerase n=1 Tax=Gallibacterium faecale TaxID=3019086 RepID=UPI0022F1BF28|nr:peptidylprolyl isomerase [Gallibacterium sp. AGMB14963]MDA3978343.1 peptidylprolyl isomerase [Gallibacterium sp. AGMB14963]
MMEKLRGYTNSVVWKVIMGLIAVSFVLSGVAGYLISRQNTSAATVNGVEISQQLFQQQYQAQYQQLAMQMGDKFAAVADSADFTNGLRKSVLERLINEELLRQYIDELKLGVGDNAVKQAIVMSPNFQKDGKFDNALYQQLLTSNNLTSEQYANLVRQDLVMSQLMNSLLGTDFLTADQQQQFVKLFFQKRTVRLATFPIAPLAEKQAISDQEVEAYYNQHKAAFATPELVKVQYLDLNKDDLAKNLQVSDVEIAQYYQDNKAQFMGQASQHLEHIQVATEAEANDIYQKLQQDANFEQLAKQYSIDKLTAVNGGDLSWVVAGQLPKAFEAAANETAVGAYSKPTKVDDKYHIIKVLARNEAKVLPLEQVKSKIADVVRQDLATRQYFSVEKAVADKAFEDQSGLAAAAKEGNLTVKETDYFARDDVPAALNFSNVVSEIFSPELVQGGMNSSMISVGENHSVMFRVMDYKAAGTKPLAEAKAQIVDLLQRQKAEKIELERVKGLVAKLQAGDTSAVEFKQDLTAVYAESKNPTLDKQIFAMSKPVDNKPSYHVGANDNGDIIVIALDKVEDGQLSAEQEKAFVSQLMQIRQNDLQSTLLKALREKAKVEINQEMLDQLQDQ